jgi:hypothetical protein
MEQYHKIQSVFKRDEKTNKFIIGEYSRPEFEYLAKNKWQFTEKVDGTNIRIGWDGNVNIGGKTDNAQLHIDLIKELQALFPIEKFKTLYPETSMTLYGEGYGAGIQKGGGNYSQKKRFVLFDVLIGGYWLSRDNINDIASKLEIKSVPIIGSGTLNDLIKDCKCGFNSHWGNFIAEGIVARPEVELFARNGQRIITKCKYKDFNLVS